MRILRSLFLILFGCFIFRLSILEAAEAKMLADYPNQVTRDGELVVLPDKGTVYVATDFQAQWSNFNRWLTQTKLVERIEAGEDVYGLILGDAVDHKPGDPIFEPYGDVKIVDRIMQLQGSWEKNASSISEGITNLRPLMPMPCSKKPVWMRTTAGI